MPELSPIGGKQTCGRLDFDTPNSPVASHCHAKRDGCSDDVDRSRACDQYPEWLIPVHDHSRRNRAHEEYREVDPSGFEMRFHGEALAFRLNVRIGWEADIRYARLSGGSWPFAAGPLCGRTPQKQYTRKTAGEVPETRYTCQNINLVSHGAQPRCRSVLRPAIC